MNTPALLLLIVCAVVLASCATLNKTECEQADWHAIGARDGAAGYKPDRIAVHTRACAKHNIGSDTDAYQAGFNTGLNEFCQPPIAYRLGLEVESYHYLCPADRQKPFLISYTKGLERTLQLLDWRYSWLEHRYDINRYFHHSNDAEHQHRHRRLLLSLESSLDDLKHERLRVWGLLRRAESRLSAL